MIKIMATGHLTADPTTGTAGSSPFTKFSIGVTTRRKDEQGEYLSNFYNITVFSGIRESCAKYLHKGDKVLVLGDLYLRPYTDQQGAIKISPDINATDVEFINIRRESEAPQTHEKSTAPATQIIVDEEDLPF
jgi:single-strand DNA-binding protein